MTMTARLIRPALPGDLPAITSIYGANVLAGTGTFEIDPPSLADMTARHADVTGKGLPWIVSEVDGMVLGYAYANHFRLRPAYRYTLEDSIYLAPEAQGQGLGRLLLAELMTRCTALGVRQLLAVIGDADNLGSIGVHRSCGFTYLGAMPAVGWKFECWLDVVLMQRALGPGASTAPVGTPGQAG
jgi:phosphinothricin acetyltransferase